MFETTKALFSESQGQITFHLTTGDTCKRLPHFHDTTFPSPSIEFITDSTNIIFTVTVDFSK